MNNPFDPKGGEFAQNIRAIGGDDTELRQSLQAFGWRLEFPALTDENGVVLVGNRRMKIAKELGIEPVVEMINFGKGDAADAERLKLAIASNIGFQSMTPEDRKRIAEHLYGAEWTMQRIAEALGTTHKTISKDLNEFVPEVQIKSHPKTTSNPKGAGRPRSTLRPDLRKNATSKAEAAAKAVLDKGVSYEEAAAQVGMSNTVLRSAVAREEGRREVREYPEIRPEDLSLTAQQKLDTAVRQHRKKLDLEFEERVRLEVLSRTKARLLHFGKIEADYKEVVKSRRGFMKEATYKLILRCLHPDSRASLSDRVLQDAFAAWIKLKLALVAEAENPTDYVSAGMPKTAADLVKRKEEVKRERAAKRAGRNTAALEETAR